MVLFLIDVLLETPNVFKNGIDNIFQCFTISHLLKRSSTASGNNEMDPCEKLGVWSDL